MTVYCTVNHIRRTWSSMFPALPYWLIEAMFSSRITKLCSLEKNNLYQLFTRFDVIDVLEITLIAAFGGDRIGPAAKITKFYKKVSKVSISIFLTPLHGS